MPTVRRISPWNGKPYLSALINWAHPWAFGLVAFWSFREGSGTPIEIVSGRAPSVVSGTFSWAQSSAGVAGNFNSTCIAYNAVPAFGPAASWAGSCTLANTTSASNQMLIERANVNATWEFTNVSNVLQYRAGNAVSRNVISTSGLSGVRFCWGCTDTGVGTGATNGSNMFLNGEPQAAGGSGGNLPAVSNTNVISVGAYDSNHSNGPMTGTQDWIAVWNYALTAVDMSAITSGANSIWQMMQPKAGEWLFPSIAGSAAPVFRRTLYRRAGSRSVA